MYRNIMSTSWVEFNHKEHDDFKAGPNIMGGGPGKTLINKLSPPA